MTKQNPPHRAVIRLQLIVAAKRKLDDECEQRGMTQIAALSRLVEWFVEQDEVVKATILGQLSAAVAAPAARQILERIARGDQS